MTLMKNWEMFLESKQNSIELCSSVKQRKKSKPAWFINEVKNGISKKDRH